MVNNLSASRRRLQHQCQGGGGRRGQAQTGSSGSTLSRRLRTLGDAQHPGRTRRVIMTTGPDDRPLSNLGSGYLSAVISRPITGVTTERTVRRRPAARSSRGGFYDTANYRTAVSWVPEHYRILGGVPPRGAVKLAWPRAFTINRSGMHVPRTVSTDATLTRFSGESGDLSNGTTAATGPHRTGAERRARELRFGIGIVT